MLKKIAVLLFFLFVDQALGAPGEVIKSFPTPRTCSTGVAWDGSSLWVADRKCDTLYQLDPTNGSIKNTISSPGYWPMGLAWDGKYLWNSDLGEGMIYQIDPRNGLTLKSIPSPGPSPIALAWDGNHLWVADDRDDKLYQIDSEDGTAIITLPSPSPDPTGLSFDGKYLWVSDRGRDELYSVTPDKGEVIIILPSPGPYPTGLAWDGTNLWNGDYQSDKLYQLKMQDTTLFSLKEEKEAQIEFTHEFRNYGPGTVKGLDIYLALPQDQPRQKILGDIEFDPQPTNFLTDKWGQKVAHYSIKELSSPGLIRVKMKFKARIYEIQYHIFPEKVRSLKEIPPKIRQEYLADGSKYRINDHFIKNLVKEVVGQEENPYWIARKIFDYIIEHIKYELAGGWNAAPAVLKRGTGSCSEYTFAFIAMCRAAGLPARYAGSVVERGEEASLDDVFHRWAEVYLPPYGWIPIDPSGGDQELPSNQAKAIGRLSNKYLVTTLNGGDSEYLGFSYNTYEAHKFEGKCRIHSEAIAEWEPLREKGKKAESSSEACKIK